MTVDNILRSLYDLGFERTVLEHRSQGIRNYDFSELRKINDNIRSLLNEVVTLDISAADAISSLSAGSDDAAEYIKTEL